MKTVLESLIQERLTSLGVTTIPASALDILTADVLRGLDRVLRRHISRATIPRAVAASLAKGRKGQSPLPSESNETKYESNCVAGSISLYSKGGVA